MAKFHLGDGRTRRELFPPAVAAGIALLADKHAFGASDFWNKKKPSEWTDQEKEEIRTKSPWAKKVDAESSGGGAGRKDQGGAGDFSSLSGGEVGGAVEGTSESGGSGGGRRGGGSRGPIPSSVPQTATLAIVWQSAKPVQDAHPIALPAKLDNHYVISVTGIPPRLIGATITAGDDPTAGLKKGATLVVKGKDPLNADVVLSMNRNITLVFGFAKDALPLSVADKDAEFQIKLPGFAAKTKFSLKDMVYNEQLAV